MTTWRTVLRHFIRDNHLFRPSYTIEDMTLQDLEHATSCSQLFLSRVARGSETLTQPTIVELLTNEDGGDDSTRCSVSGAKLVPGGRYLLTRMTKATLEFLDLWDLGDVRYRLHGYTPRKLASKSYGHALPVLVRVHPTKCGLGLVVLAGWR